MEPRGERLQIMLTKEELVALDNWRFDSRMPSRASAIRELLRRGLSAEGFAVSDGTTKSGDFSVISDLEGHDDGAKATARRAEK
jgi:metal-responsive CopG/Arc/MetJ family transcriptional regulator